MAGTSRAVFLSYASEDTEAAGRIAGALAGAGIEVWFDKSALRGGDAWDQRIREQIRACRLFVAIISAHTESRGEGYFRREWKLAVDRTEDMASDLPFLLPVVIDDTADAIARVPQKFRELQWTRLPGGAASTAFVERVVGLLAEAGHVARAAAAAAPGTLATAPGAAPGDVTAAARAMPDRSLSAGLAGATQRLPAKQIRRWRRWGFHAAIGLSLLYAIAYFGYARLHAPGAASAPAIATPGAAAGLAAPAATASPSIAVLPLANLSQDPNQQYFSDGLSEGLIDALARIPDLKVIGKTSSFVFRDSKESSRSIGEQLGVTRLLEGSVQRAADKIRVTAELINAADGTTVWSEKYDRPYKDLFALQDELTRAVAGALKTKLLPSAAAQDERLPGGNLEAYNDYLQGRFHGGHQSEAEQRAAIDYYTRAVQIDPRYALAWSGLSTAQTGLAVLSLSGPDMQQMQAQARAAADRALTLAPQLAEAHMARAYLLMVADFDWRGAEAEYRRALALAPGNAVAQFRLSTLLATLGDVPQAIALTRQALAQEPLRANWYGWLSSYFVGLHRLDEAEQAIRQALELDRSDAWLTQLAVVQILQHKPAAALATAQQASEGVWKDTALALATQAGSDRAAADATLKTLIDRHSDESAYQIAETYALRGDAAATFQWLDRAWTNRDGGITSLLFDPLILRYQDDPRFAAFCRKVGLPVPGERARHAA